MKRRAFLKTIVAGALAPVAAKVFGVADLVMPDTTVARCVTNLLPFSEMEDMLNCTGFSYKKLKAGRYMFSYYLKGTEGTEDNPSEWLRYVQHYTVAEDGPAQIKIEVPPEVLIKHMQFEGMDNDIPHDDCYGIACYEGVSMTMDWPSDERVALNLTTHSDGLLIQRSDNKKL